MMKLFMTLILTLGFSLTFAAPVTKSEISKKVKVSPTPTTQASVAIPWTDWFKKNVLSTDKKTYVHIFWNAQDVRTRFVGKNKISMLAQAAQELTKTQLPKSATADLVKIDIVYVRERDSYGMPKWDTLERVVHLETSRSALVNATPSVFKAPDAEIQKLFTVFKIF